MKMMRRKWRIVPEIVVSKSPKMVRVKLGFNQNLEGDKPVGDFNLGIKLEHVICTTSGNFKKSVLLYTGGDVEVS